MNVSHRTLNITLALAIIASIVAVALTSAGASGHGSHHAAAPAPSQKAYSAVPTAEASIPSVSAVPSAPTPTPAAAPAATPPSTPSASTKPSPIQTANITTDPSSLTLSASLFGTSPTSWTGSPTATASDVIAAFTESGGSSPTGAILVDVYSNSTCSGATLAQDISPSFANGRTTIQAQLAGFMNGVDTFFTPGTYSLVGNYAGDANNSPAQTSCTSFTIPKNTPTFGALNVAVSGNVATLSAPVSNAAWDYDTGIATNPGGGAITLEGAFIPQLTGTFTFSIYPSTDSTCTSSATWTGTASLVNTEFDNSIPASSALTAGNYYAQESFSGDGLDSSATSACTEFAG